MISVLENMDLCVGCASCAQRCNHKSLTMKPDDEGFLFPSINQSTCTDCGLCKKACPVANNAVTNGGETPSGVYACWSKNDELRFKSTSGALFSSFAENTLKNGGTVFGAAFDDQFQVQHVGITESSGLEGLRGSKYVQSSINDSYLQAEALLKASKPVLFSGTPCQIAGLKALLGKEYEKLTTIDLACHGVPSPKIWSMYLDHMKGLYKGGIKQIFFRHKQDGWQKSNMRIDFDNGKTYMEKVYKETYFIGFGKSIFNRKCCFQCNFKLQNTQADITLADFWGIEKLQGIDVSDNKGVSLLLAHTPKGHAALSEIRGALVIQERFFAEGVKGNPRLLTSAPLPPARKEFFLSVKNGSSFEALRRKYMDNSSPKYKLKRAVKAFLGQPLIDLLNKLRKPLKEDPLADKTFHL